jgi:CheY-like chemotaxis protein
LDVLIADDNHDAAESLAILLRMEGHEVRIVNDGAEAVKAYDAAPADAAILDIGMPGLNGYEVARHIRSTSPDRKALLIALTGWGQDQDKAQAMAAGFNHHLTRPVDPDRVTALLRPAART